MSIESELRSATHEALVAQTRALVAISDAISAVESVAIDDPAGAPARAALEHAVLLNAKGKWLNGRAIGTYRGIAPITGSLDDVVAGRHWCERALAVAQRAAAGDGLADDEREQFLFGANGTEILWCDGVPLVPSVCPVVVLRGSSFEMGRQYAEQLIEIFGSFVLRQLAGRSVDPAFRAAVEPWERELAQHAPELVDFSRGWAEGARGRGIPMDYWDVVAVWTGAHPPTMGPVGFSVPDGCDVRGIPASPLLDAYLAFDRHSVAGAYAPGPPCSGAAAWGSATAGGGAVAACSTDHDGTFQATIVAFPDEGHPFIYTPFAANGFIPAWGDFFMAGHPGLNAAGLAYVHHGGGYGMTEPLETWGYGLRRGAETFHNLRYAADTSEALRYDLTLPVGDAGYPVAYPGGFYVDGAAGMVVEGRTGVPDAPAPIVRERSQDEAGESYDFLYATNNALSPESAAGFAAPAGGYRYGEVEGWHTTLDDEVLRVRTPETAARRWTAFSWKRNRYLFERLRERSGLLTLDDMVAIYQDGGPCVFAAAQEGGEDRQAVSAAHRGAAFTAALDVDARRYLGCVGPAGRGLAPMAGMLPFVYHDETHQFWELTLADDPASLVEAAATQARRDVDAAADVNGPERRAWAARARDALGAGDERLGEAGGDDPAALGRAVRRFTTAQVQARRAAAAQQS